MATRKWITSHRKEIQEYQRQWYQRNKTTQKRWVAKRKQELQIWYQELKSLYKCIECKKSHPAIIDFHHRDPTKKDLDLAVAIQHGWSKERVLKEIAKCNPICANCHRILHWNERHSK